MVLGCLSSDFIAVTAVSNGTDCVTFFYAGCSFC